MGAGDDQDDSQTFTHIQGFKEGLIQQLYFFTTSRAFAPRESAEISNRTKLMLYSTEAPDLSNLREPLDLIEQNMAEL